MVLMSKIPISDKTLGKGNHQGKSNPFNITNEETKISKALLEEAEIDLALYDELEKVKFTEDLKLGVERRKIFLLQQAEEKAVKSTLPSFVRMAALPLLAMGVFFDEPPISIRRVIEIYKKRTIEHLEKAFDRKKLGHSLSRNFDFNRLFEDFLVVLTLIYQTDPDLLDYVNESVEITKSKDINRVLKEQDVSKLTGSIEEMIKKLEKFNTEGYTEETAVFATREFFAFTAISINITARNIGILNILEGYEQSSRYPDQIIISENDPIFKQKEQIRNCIAEFIKVNQKNIK